MYNSKTSFNFKLQQIVQDISIELKEDIRLFNETDQFIQYPCVKIYYLQEGMRDQSKKEHMHLLQIDVYTNNDQSKLGDLIMQKIYNKFGLNRYNVHQFAIIPKFDYLSSMTAPQRLSNMRIVQIGDGWRRVPDFQDRQIRHYALTMELFFKLDTD